MINKNKNNVARWHNIRKVCETENAMGTQVRQFRKLDFSHIVKELFQLTEAAPRDVPKKRCFENMQQFNKRTPMPKCHFNKVALQLY